MNSRESAENAEPSTSGQSTGRSFRHLVRREILGTQVHRILQGCKHTRESTTRFERFNIDAVYVDSNAVIDIEALGAEDNNNVLHQTPKQPVISPDHIGNGDAEEEQPRQGSS